MAGRPAGRGPRAWWRRLSLRARLTVLATLVVAGGLVAGALLLVGSLQASLLRSLDDTARQRAQDVAALVDEDRLPATIPVAGAGTVLVQVVDEAGRVTAASAGADRAVPLLPPAELAAARADRAPRFLRGDRIGEGAPLRVVAWPAGPARAPVTVVAAVSVTNVADSVHVVAAAMVVGVPVLLTLLAATTWVTVGSTFRPVSALRRGAEEITGTGASRRLPLPAARDEVWRLGVTLNRMLDRLEEAGRHQRAFVADAAHELRSPLASMRTQLEVALCHPELADWPATADAVLQDALRLGRMAEDLLALARLDEGQAPPRRKQVDLGDLVRAVVRRLPAPAVPVEVRAAAGVRVRGDPDGLARVVQNLLDNALRYAATRVEVSVRAEGALAVLAVADDGPGVPPADRQRVFERFTRLDDARSRELGGAGLGLAIVREIARAHGGEVTVDDAGPAVTVDDGSPSVEAGGPGARFVVWLPAEQAHRELTPAAPASAAPDPSAAVKAGTAPGG